MTARQLPYVPKFVFIGEQGLKGGGDRASEPSDSEPSQPVAAPQGHHEPSQIVHHFRGVLELAGSQGPNELDRAQLEAKQLQGKIAELSSNFPKLPRKLMRR